MLDLSRVLAGPYCSMVLADLGADVIKVERPEGGDETRSWGPPFAAGEAAYFLAVNRGKRSVAIDLADPQGRDLALELCAGAQVVIENFRAGGAERLGRGLRERARAQSAGGVLLGHRIRLAPRAGRAAGIRLRGPGRERADVRDRTGGRLAVQGRRGARGRARRPARRGRNPGRAQRRRGRADRGAPAGQRSRRLGQRGPERTHHRSGPRAARERASEHRAVPGLRDGVRSAGGGGGERRALPRPLPRDRAGRARRGRALRHERGPGGASDGAGGPARAPLPRAFVRRVGGRARRRRRAGRAGALRSRRARGGGGGRPAGDRAGAASSRRRDRARGLADLDRRRGGRPLGSAALGSAHRRGAA